jgi:hypothetical protein
LIEEIGRNEINITTTYDYHTPEKINATLEGYIRQLVKSIKAEHRTYQ